MSCVGPCGTPGKGVGASPWTQCHAIVLSMSYVGFLIAAAHVFIVTTQQRSEKHVTCEETQCGNNTKNHVYETILSRSSPRMDVRLSLSYPRRLVVGAGLFPDAFA
jgi:hypothetical protein